MTSPMKAAIHFGPNYLTNSEICKNKIRGDLFINTLKLVMERSAKILNVKCLEYSSLSWASSVLAIDQAIKLAKAKVCLR